MKRFRLSTLMLLIVIAALVVALLVQHDRATRREAELQARLHKAQVDADLLIERAVVKDGKDSRE
jgi:type II secretory pathway component PulK